VTSALSAAGRPDDEAGSAPDFATSTSARRATSSGLLNDEDATFPSRVADGRRRARWHAIDCDTSALDARAGTLCLRRAGRPGALGLSTPTE
jgi:hypothetical protein